MSGLCPKCGLDLPSSGRCLICGESDTSSLKKNVYLCQECGYGMVTADEAEGVTPFLTSCIHCSKVAMMSLMYRIPQVVLARIPPARRWVKPSEEQLKGKSAQVVAHVRNGGLIRDDTV